MTTLVELTRPYSPFGAILTNSEYPLVQIDAIYGLLTNDHETFTATGGSATSENALFTCTTGTSVGGYGVIRSVRDGHYHAGQGLCAKFTASFTTGVALSLQQAGAFNAENALCFGYNGTSFGVLRRTSGALEIRTLTVSAGAGGSETATVTLNGVATNVALTSGNAAHACFQLAAASYTGWAAYQTGTTVVFVAQSTGAKSGAYTLASTGTAAGTFAQTRAGATETDTWVAQADWNVDKMNGEGPSRMTLDPTKLNVYQIQWQWLGAGAIVYSIENPKTGFFQPVHRIEYAGSSTAVSVRNPTFKVGWVAASLGSTTNLTVSGASAAIFEYAQERTFLRGPRSATATKASIGATDTAVLAIRNNKVFRSQVNFREVRVLRVAVGTDGSGSAPVTIKIWTGASLPGSGGAADEPAWAATDSANSCVDSDSAAETVSGGALVAVLNCAKTGQQSIDLRDFGLQLDSDETLVISASTTSGTVTVSASVTWVED